MRTPRAKPPARLDALVAAADRAGHDQVHALPARTAHLAQGVHDRQREVPEVRTLRQGGGRAEQHAERAQLTPGPLRPDHVARVAFLRERRNRVGYDAALWAV